MMQDNSFDMPDLNEYNSEINDVRAALRKSTFPTANIDKEWQLFASSHVKDATKRPNHALWLVSGIAIGVAATLLCLLVLSPIFKSKEAETFIVFSSVEQSDKVEMTSTYHANSNNNKLFGDEKQQTKTVAIAQDIIDMRSAATPNSVVEERTVRTPRGKAMKIVLADGTEVLLNADSRLSFPTRFTGTSRSVRLEGEAYFSVAKDAKHPFSVTSGNIITTALGTEFNVKAYNAKEISVALLTGSVTVSDTIVKKKTLLKPGEGVNAVNGKLIVADINPKTFTYWKEGFFYFDNVPLVDILTELGRWYNVTIELKSRSLMSYRLHFAADRNQSLSEAIERLNKFTYLHATFDGKKLIIDNASHTQE